jgi:large subunit ribosomal protein L1
MAPLFPAFQQVRGAKGNAQKGKGKNKGKDKTVKPDRRGPREFRQRNLKDMEQFALCDAMRYALPFLNLVKTKLTSGSADTFGPPKLAGNPPI